MNLTKNIVALLALCGSCLIFQATANETPAFRFTTREIPERGPVKALQISVGLERVSFILPKNWRAGQTAEDLVLQATDYSATLNVHSVKNSETLSRDLKAGMTEAAPQAVLGEEYAWTTSLGEATVIDMRSGEDQKLPTQSRTYIIKLKEQSLVITLTSTVQNFAKAELQVASLIASLRTE